MRGSPLVSPHPPDDPPTDPFEDAWDAYRGAFLEHLHGLPRKKQRVTEAQHSAEGFKRFLDAARFLNISIINQIQCLGISRRTYFYWLRASKDDRLIQFRPNYSDYSFDYKFWLVWKGVELARLRFDSDEVMRLWFSSPNPRFPKAGTCPTSLLFNSDTRRKPMVLRALMEIPSRKG